MFPDHWLQDFSFLCKSCWLEEHVGGPGSSPSQRLFFGNHRECFVTVGPALARSSDTMPASIYLYPVETEVFGLVSSGAEHTECTNAERLFLCAHHP